MEDQDEIYDMADENAKVDTESVVSPKDFIKRLNQNAKTSEMAGRMGGGTGVLPPKPAFKPKDLLKTQGALRPTTKENNRNASNAICDTGNVASELAQRLANRRKISEEVGSSKSAIVDTNSIAAGLAKGLADLEKKRSMTTCISDSASVEIRKTPAVRPVEVLAPKTSDQHKRPPAPLPKTVTLPVPAGKPLASPKPDKPDLSAKFDKPISVQTVKQDTNNNGSEISKRKTEYKFEIITHKRCKYMAYKLPLVVGSKPRKPFRTADTVVPSKYSDAVRPKPISVIEPTASDEEEEEEVGPPAHHLPPSVHIKGISSLTSADDDELYDDGESAIAPTIDEDDGELYEAFDDEELERMKQKREEEEKRLKEKEERKRQKEEKKKGKEQKKHEKEKKKKQKDEQEQKEKYKIDGTERVLFSGVAKDKITRGMLVSETLFEKGEDVPVMRTDESINPKGKWLVQLKDGKYEYIDIKQVEVEQKKEPPVNDGGYEDDENIYEGEDYDEGFSRNPNEIVEEEDIYEDL